MIKTAMISNLMNERRNERVTDTSAEISWRPNNDDLLVQDKWLMSKLHWLVNYLFRDHWSAAEAKRHAVDDIKQELKTLKLSAQFHSEHRTGKIMDSLFTVLISIIFLVSSCGFASSETSKISQSRVSVLIWQFNITLIYSSLPWYSTSDWFFYFF